MRKLILPIIATLFLLNGCISSKAGVVKTSNNKTFVTVGAGEINLGFGELYAWYIIDPKTETCWLFAHSALSPLNCCNLKKVSEASEHITWLKEGSCTK